MSRYKKYLYSMVALGVFLIPMGVSANQGEPLDSFDSRSTTQQQEIQQRQQQQEQQVISGNTSQNTNIQEYTGTNLTVDQQGLENFNQNTGTAGDALKGFTPVTAEDLANARSQSGWFFDMFSWFLSFVIICAFLFSVVTTGVDILYIAVPFTRKFLYTAGTDGAGGVNGMSGHSGQSMGGGIQWVSDEAVMVASMLGGNAQSQGHGGGFGAAPGMGGGMMGGGMMGGGMGAQSNATQQNGGKSPLRIYLQKRLFFYVILGISSVLLFSSAFTDFGINVGGMLLNLLQVISSKLGGLNIG